MDRISILIDLILTASLIEIKKINDREWRKLSLSERHWPTIWYFALKRNDPTILNTVFEHTKFEEPRESHLDILNSVIEFGRHDLVKRIMSTNTYSSTVILNFFPTPAIFSAVMYDQFDILKTLLEVGASPNAYWFNTSCLRECLDRNDLPMARLLLENGADPTWVFEIWGPAIFSASSIEAIRLLIEFGADLNQRDKMGKSLLHKKVEHREVDFIKQALNVSLIQDLKYRTNEGDTPLHYAVYADSIPTI